MDQIAIDFETANSNLDSACSIGIVGVENDKVLFQKHYLINPLTEFNAYNTTIHNITAEDVKNSPTFKEVWEDIKDYFNGIVIAHNAGFDLAVLKVLVEKYNLEVPSIKIACTLKISQKLWKGILPNCKLNTISNYLEVEHNHHNALSDAYVCYAIIERAKRVTNSDTIEEVMESLGLRFGSYKEDKFFLPKNKYKDINLDALDNYFKGRVVAFGGKPKNMTKKRVVETLQIKGAILSKELDRSVDTFILFENVRKERLVKLDELKSKVKIEVISEEEFLKLI